MAKSRSSVIFFLLRIKIERAQIELIRAKKSLGQNFLIDGRVSRRIIAAVSPQPSDLIIEVGPGRGALTRLLGESCAHLIAIEIDSRLIKELRDSIDSEKVTILNADALEVDWEELIELALGRLRDKAEGDAIALRARVVANLPYYISTPIIEKLIGARRLIYDMTLMLQNEVVERIASSPGSRDYGYLSVFVQYYCESRKLFEVPPNAFKPAPKVRSAVVKLMVREQPPIEVSDERLFFSLVRAAFAQRRKTITNNLKAAAHSLGFARPIDAALEKSGTDSRRRAETFSLAEFGALYDALYEK